MATVIVVDTASGSMDRFEMGGSCARKTHSCKSFDLIDEDAAKALRLFRQMPDNKYSVEPPPSPTNPPAGAGIVRIAA